MRRCRIDLVVAAILSMSLSGGTASAEILVGPHLQAVRQDGVVVLWSQSEPGPGAVTIDGLRHDSPTEGPLHEVTVAGLLPGREYEYAVDASGEIASGAFRTAPAATLLPFRFVVMGDNRSNHDSHAEVVAAIRAEGALEFLVNTGDMVSSGDVEDDWRSFFDIERLLIGSTPWFPVVGNHEEEDGALPHFFNYYLAPPTDSSGREAYYSFTYANSAFIVLDGHTNVTPQLFGLWTNYDATQRSWLEEVLDQYTSDPTVQHIFVFNHEPPYSSKEGRYGNRALRLLMPLLLDHGIDAVISGHDHYLERGESPGGLPYFIMGGGGAPLYDNESEGSLGYKLPMALPWLDDGHTVHFARSSYGYMVVTVENGQVDVEIKDEAGESLDRFSWNTGDLVPPEPDGGPGDGGPGDGGVRDADVDAVPGEPPLDGAVIPPGAEVDADANVDDEAGFALDAGAVDPSLESEETGCACRAAPSSPGGLASIVSLAILGLSLALRR